MKTSTKVNLITIASFFLVGAVLVLIGGAKGNWKKETLFPVTVYEQERYEIASSKVQSLDCYVPNANIRLSPSSDNRVRVTYYNSSRGKYAVQVDDRTGELTIRYHDKSFLAQYLQVGSKLQKHTLLIELPADALTKLNVKTGDGDITLDHLGAKESVFLTSTGGSITLEGLLPAVSTKLTSSNGNISGSLHGSAADFKITSTDPWLGSFQDGAMEMTVTSTSGKINLRFLG